jgi:archaellum biogenesis ATPase FlaH
LLIDNIFAHCIKSTNFFRIVFPHIKPNYFQTNEDKLLFKKIKSYQERYNKIPTFADLKLYIDTDVEVSIEDTNLVKEKLNSLKKVELVSDEQMLIDQTEDWCRNRAIEISTYDFIESLENNKPDKAAKIEKIKEAMGIEFNVQLGHDYFNDAQKRMEYYLLEQDRIPLNIDVMNEALGGGLVKKTMSVILSSTNVGKTTNLAHYASGLVMDGYNVIYITGEESEEEILKKNDANILDIDIDSLSKKLDKNLFKTRFKNVCQKSHGRLKVKEFYTGTASAAHIRNLLIELKLKENFVPDVVVLDGLNNFASCKLPASQAGTAIYVKNVAEEQRALCGEFNYALLTNAQFNRGAKGKVDKADLEDVGEAYAISQTADWASSLIQTDELREQGKYLIKVLKTRISKAKGKIYTIGIDYVKMRLLNLSAEDQEIPLVLKDQLKAQAQMKNDVEQSIALFDFGE